MLVNKIRLLTQNSLTFVAIFGVAEEVVYNVRFLANSKKFVEASQIIGLSFSQGVLCIHFFVNVVKQLWNVVYDWVQIYVRRIMI